MIRTFFSHLFESIKSLKRNGWMTVASASAVTITLVLVGIFMGVIFNATKLADDVEKNVTVSVFVDIGTKQNEMKTLEKQLKGLDNVEDISYSNKDQQLKKIQEQMGDAWNLFEGDSNPLYDVYYAQTVRTWGLAAAALLLFVAVFLISNTIRITILSRQKEIQIMRLVGAKNSFIRWPFFLEGAWIGLIGAIVPVIIMTLGYHQVYNMFNPQLLRSNYSLIRPEDFIWKVNLLMIATGMIIGSLGSVISMRRFLKI